MPSVLVGRRQNSDVDVVFCVGVGELDMKKTSGNGPAILRFKKISRRRFFGAEIFYLRNCGKNQTLMVAFLLKVYRFSP